MPTAPSRPLTKRQQAVMERIDRRVPIKVIAQELGVSETRVNQHIRALKDIFGAENLGDLVESYRMSRGESDKVEPAQDPVNTTYNVREADRDAAKLKGLSEASLRKSQVGDPGAQADHGDRVDRGELVMSDAMPLAQQAPWLKPKEPQVVPGLLDGDNAVLLRLAAIVGIAFGCLAAVVLTVTAAVTISEALDGRAAVPVDEQNLS
ncbi:MAG: LuxR C-terminal-related transcriptional regulator [Erythrobacter sp.]|uniref:LuxR C-terminal-related transcriptional regulator n=1 Tax=Erythrobacter sp. TaxID=1042 RepID=UPI0032EFBDA2